MTEHQVAPGIHPVETITQATFMSHDFHEIPGNIRLRQELPERGIMGSGCAVFLLHQPWLWKMTRRCYHSPGKANIGGERNCHFFWGLLRGSSQPSSLLQTRITVIADKRLYLGFKCSTIG